MNVDGDKPVEVHGTVYNLSEDEIARRAQCDVAEAMAQLLQEHRAIRVTIAGVRRWIAAEQAGVYRDALGVVPPPGLPASFLAATDNPLAVIAQRFAHTHGPFVTQDLATRLGLRPAQLEPVLRALLEFLGLPWDEACLEFQKARSQVKTASLWQVREPLHTRSSGRWQNYQPYIEHIDALEEQGGKQ